MQRTLRISLLVAILAIVAITSLSKGSAADFSAVWDGGTGNWGDPLHWSTNPNYPNNTGEITYDATVNNGSVTLDRDITVSRFLLTGGTLTSGRSLTILEGFTWTGGMIQGDYLNNVINLASGSVSHIDIDLPEYPYTPRLNGGTINNSGTVYQASLIPVGAHSIINNLIGATWNMQSTVALSRGVIFNNSGAFVGRGAFVQVGSAFNSSGTVTLGSDGTRGSTLELGGGGTVGGTFKIAAQSYLNFERDVVDSVAYPYTLTAGAAIRGNGVSNIGYLTELNVTGNAIINTRLNNNSKLTLQPGVVLTLTGNFSQSNFFGTTTRLNNSTINSALPLNFESGSLVGSGTINGDVIHNGTISPGSSAGSLTINGGVSLLNNSKIVMEIGGLTQGTQYDYLAISGMVSLDGVLELHILNGFNLKLDPKQTFTLLTSSSLSGAFANITNGARLTTADGLASFQVNYGAGSPYGANNLVLSDPQGVPEPMSLVLFAGGAAALAIVRYRRK